MKKLIGTLASALLGAAVIGGIVLLYGIKGDAATPAGGSCPLNSGPGYQSNGNRYFLSEGAYPSTDDIEAAVKKQYGSQATVADWSDFRGTLGSLPAITKLVGDLGLKRQSLDESCDNYFVTWNGEKTKDGMPFILARHDGQPPKDWLILDQIGDNQLDLGRWKYSSQAIVKLPISQSDPSVSANAATADENAVTPSSNDGSADTPNADQSQAENATSPNDSPISCNAIARFISARIETDRKRLEAPSPLRQGIQLFQSMLAAKLGFSTVDEMYRNTLTGQRTIFSNDKTTECDFTVNSAGEAMLAAEISGNSSGSTSPTYPLVVVGYFDDSGNPYYRWWIDPDANAYAEIHNLVQPQ